MFNIKNEDFVGLPLNKRDRGMKITTALHEAQAARLASIFREQALAEKHNKDTALNFNAKNIMQERAKSFTEKVIERNSSIKETMLQEFAGMIFKSLPFDADYVEENATVIADRISKNLHDHFDTIEKLHTHVYSECGVELQSLYESIELFFAEESEETFSNTNAIYRVMIPTIVNEQVSNIITDYINTVTN